MDSVLCVAALSGEPVEGIRAITVEDDPHSTGDAIRDTDWPLIEAIVAGDDDALEELMQRHQHALFHFVYRYLGNGAAARDAVQETFVRVYFKAGAFRPRSTVKTWIYSIALNYCRDAARKLGRAPAMVSLDEPAEISGTSRDIVDSGATPDTEAADADRHATLRQAIDRLPDRLKSALVLGVLEQRPHKEVAEILHTTPKTVELRIYRAKAKLRAWLSADETLGRLHPHNVAQPFREGSKRRQRIIFRAFQKINTRAGSYDDEAACAQAIRSLKPQRHMHAPLHLFRLAALVGLLSGCATYQFKVDAIKAPDSPFGVSYRLHSAHPGITEDDARFLEAAEYVKTALSSKGMFEAPAGVTPDMTVEIDFGIDSERTEQRIEPGNAHLLANALINVVIYEKYVRITARENPQQTGDYGSRELWSVYVTNENEDDDLREYLPLLVSAAMDAIDSDSKGRKLIDLGPNDARVVFVKSGM
ncbi:MAG TPA: RNA polymerase sigma factor [Opitutaceae bacterium]